MLDPNNRTSDEFMAKTDIDDKILTYVVSHDIDPTRIKELKNYH